MPPYIAASLGVLFLTQFLHIVQLIVQVFFANVETASVFEKDNAVVQQTLNTSYPHAQASRGKVGCWCPYTCLLTTNILDSYFSDRLTFSKICGRTSRRIYRLALSFLQKCFPR